MSDFNEFISYLHAQQQQRQLTQEEQSYLDVNIRLADLQAKLELAIAQDYCTICGKTLDGYMKDETLDKLKTAEATIEEIITQHDRLTTQLMSDIDALEAKLKEKPSPGKCTYCFAHPKLVTLCKFCDGTGKELNESI